MKLEIKNLKVFFNTREGVIKAINDISLTVHSGQIIGIVGESGSGKSVTGLSIMRLLDKPGEIAEGSILYNNKDLSKINNQEIQKIRGNEIAMIFQDAMMSLNPIMKIENQMIEAIRAHQNISRKEALLKSIKILSKVGITNAKNRISSYPHEFSGGMKQRVAIAIALINKPKLIIADEPTTALDVTTQTQILHITQELCKDNNTALIWITHDISVLSGLVNEIYVMYAGRIMEKGSVNDIIDSPKHPYTIGLLGSIPNEKTKGKRLKQITGMVKSLLNIDEGCAFRDRCSFSTNKCMTKPKKLEITNTHFVNCFNPVLKKNNYE